MLAESEEAEKGWSYHNGTHEWRHPLLVDQCHLRPVPSARYRTVLIPKFSRSFLSFSGTHVTLPAVTFRYARSGRCMTLLYSLLHLVGIWHFASFTRGFLLRLSLSTLFKCLFAVLHGVAPSLQWSDPEVRHFPVIDLLHTSFHLIHPNPFLPTGAIAKCPRNSFLFHMHILQLQHCNASMASSPAPSQGLWILAIILLVSLLQQRTQSYSTYNKLTEWYVLSSPTTESSLTPSLSLCPSPQGGTSLLAVSLASTMLATTVRRS